MSQPRTPAIPVWLSAGLAVVLALTGCTGDTPQVATGEAATAPAARPHPDRGSPGPAAGPTTEPAPQHNPMTDPARDPLSTFALDVDTGSWTRARSRINAGATPAPGEVRTEEFVNYFDQGYRPPADGLDIRMDATGVAWLAPHTRVLRVGVQSAVVDDSRRPPANLTFVIDTSGSMADQLPAVQQALTALTGSLRPNDTIAIVTYGSQARTVLQRTPVAEADRIRGVIADLSIAGSTNAEEGLRLGYEQATRGFRDGELNRVVLLSDGVANVGKTGPEAILETIGKAAQNRIDLVTVGFGADFNDQLMEQLANRGNGFFVYVDSAKEAERVFTQNLTGTLMVTGRDAKAQVRFNPSQVAGYRLLGYENRDVADRDFRNDQVDGGEVGSGHSTTALYEVVLKNLPNPVGALASATVRYRDAGTGEWVERTDEIGVAETVLTPDAADPRLHQAVVVASFAESLRGGPWAQRRTPTQIAEDARGLRGRLADPKVVELADLTAKYAE
ncbi:vWA domain-containing protein [Granulicoccus phenolivorans]|uniref:vWA domain-containing protein n=1 Tax=Granulicoccus phenolivorans TaxID=266854 RepID=UPI000413EAFF|nr:von Willebrand factor type A domain-containing protein [Granulicoccus phenolivorans]